ncbi:hypothetical protein [Paraburkholderia diazotrophica]|uniref:hypothetical protein n=1 Tax=Paraburkholderia diazotrophica TaxID=667676 RepID=UPI003181196E
MQLGQQDEIPMLARGSKNPVSALQAKASHQFDCPDTMAQGFILNVASLQQEFWDSTAPIRRMSGQNGQRELQHEMKRDQAMNDDHFREFFLTAQGRPREVSVAYVQIDNDLELYLLK